MASGKAYQSNFLTVGTKDDRLFLSPEEAAIHLICQDLDHTWIPMDGEAIIGRLKQPLESPAAMTA